MRMQPAKIAVIGVDLGKNSCSLAALDGNGAVVKRRRKLQEGLTEMMAREGDSGLSPRMRLLIEDMQSQWVQLDQRIVALDDEMWLNAKEDDAARQLTTIPGIGVLNATALIAAIGSGAALLGDGTWLPGSDWFRGKSLQAGGPAWLASRSATTNICENY